MNKTVAVLGATGSVGLQALDVIRHAGHKLDFFSASSSVDEAEKIAREFSPAYVAMANEKAAGELKIKLADTPTKVLFGKEGIIEGIKLSRAKTVLNSIIGGAGLLPTLAVLDSKKRLALANKESLVIAGDEVMKRARESALEIIPVDSEHSAIFQSLKSGRQCEIKKIILTASGGPFFGKSREELSGVTLADTLAHPTWKMGKKITVDSATLMNKGFEVIEAAHLFGVSADKIEVVIHRESILHSAVEYIDNSVIAELSVPDMRMCCQYAIDYPERKESPSEELDLFKVGSLTFKKPDYEAFPLLSLAFTAMKKGGALPAIVNAADEVFVAKFLDGKISYAQISEKVIKVFDKMSSYTEGYSVDEIIAIDKEARRISEEI